MLPSLKWQAWVFQEDLLELMVAIGQARAYTWQINLFAKALLVTAINPTPAGEGKTTTSVGLADVTTSMLALREPSLRPSLVSKGVALRVADMPGSSYGGH